MFYAYFIEKTNEQGILNDWQECLNLIKGKKSRYKKFKTKKEAETWLLNGAKYENKNNSIEDNLIKSAIFFDAGTGRGNGVEVRVTDYKKNSILPLIISKKLINEYGNYYVDKKRTNNFGELSGLFFALKFALKNDIKDICGDSELVIKYWANLIYNKNNLDNDTIELIIKVNNLYEKFKKNGGTLHKISGDINPADLGFHK